MRRKLSRAVCSGCVPECFDGFAVHVTQALMIHKDHVSAVMDVAFSPTGQEFASGSYDRTVRVFPHRSGRSREVYHTKRMQRVFCVNFSADARQAATGARVKLWGAASSAGVMLSCKEWFRRCQVFDNPSPATDADRRKCCEVRMDLHRLCAVCVAGRPPSSVRRVEGMWAAGSGAPPTRS